MEFCPHCATELSPARRISETKTLYRCRRCGRLCTSTYETPFYRLHTEPVDVLAAVRMWADGVPLARIGRVLGICASTVMCLLDKASEFPEDTARMLELSPDDTAIVRWMLGVRRAKRQSDAIRRQRAAVVPATYQGVPTHTPVRDGAFYNAQARPDDMLTAVQMWADGETLRKIGRHIGACAATVMHLLDKASEFPEETVRLLALPPAEQSLVQWLLDVRRAKRQADAVRQQRAAALSVAKQTTQNLAESIDDGPADGTPD